MSLFTLALNAAFSSEDEAHKVEVAVTFLSRQAAVPAGIARNPIQVKDGRVTMLGPINLEKLADQMVDQHIAEEVAAPKVLVNLGVSAQMLSYMGDDNDRTGYGYEAKVVAKGDKYSLDLKLGDPGVIGVVNDSRFVVVIKPGDSVLIEPKKQICGMPMFALVQVSKVEQEVEVFTEH